MTRFKDGVEFGVRQERERIIKALRNGGITADSIRLVIEYLKTTPAVTLSGQGGAYELLEAWAKRIEEAE